MIENKPCCCKSNQKKQCCSKKENTCCNKTSFNQAEEIRKEISNTYSKYAQEEPQCNSNRKNMLFH